MELLIETKKNNTRVSLKCIVLIFLPFEMLEHAYRKKYNVVLYFIYNIIGNSALYKELNTIN